MIRVYVLIAAGVIALIYYTTTWYLNKKRRGNIKLAAESLNFTYSADNGKGLLESLGVFKLFNIGGSKKITNIMTGNMNNIPVTVFDYSYITGGYKNSRARRQSVVMFESERLRLPEFILQPQNILHKMGQVFGSKDIRFEAYLTFNKLYSLRGDDEVAIRNVFNDSVISYFERHPGLSIEAFTTRLLFYRAAKQAPPAKLESFIQESCEVYKLFKK
jgi:carbonic anhydrase